MLPDELKYTKTHEWVRIGRNNTARIGITEHAQKKFDNILFVELPEIDSDLEQFDSFGVIESENTVTELFAPLSGKVISINEELEEDPKIINHDPYGDGWLIDLEMFNEDEAIELMDAKEYEEFIEQGGNDE